MGAFTVSTTTFDNILDFAIKREEEAHQFYMRLASIVRKPNMSAAFTEFAREELGHKAKLVGIKQGLLHITQITPVHDLKIAEFLLDIVPTEEIEYQQALVLAMKREKAAYKMYMDLADAVKETAMHQTFLLLAHEEAKHKLRFEVEYDEMMIEN
jgi:rubrerythrin